MATRFIIRPTEGGWAVLIQSPSLAEAAIVKRTKERSKASAFVRDQVDILRAGGEAATVHYEGRSRPELA